MLQFVYGATATYTKQKHYSHCARNNVHIADTLGGNAVY